MTHGSYDIVIIGKALEKSSAFYISQNGDYKMSDIINLENKVSSRIKKAVDIINAADDTDIEIDSDIKPEDYKQKDITTGDIINAVSDIKNSIDNTNSSPVNNSDDELIMIKDGQYITKAEWKRRNSNGGHQCQINNSKRRTAKDILNTLLQAELNRDSVDEILGASAEILGEDKTVYAVMCAKMIQIACAGDIRAFLAIRDTVGDKPADEHYLMTDVMTDADRKMIDNMKKRMDKQALSLHNEKQ